jgi:hypothetical protein
MKRRSFVLLLLSILFVLGGCNSTPEDSSNIIKITQADEKIIEEYLDKRTNDISTPYGGGKMYSAFNILGTDDNKIYVWMLKSEYLKQTNELTNGVSVPIVIYIETKGDKIEIKNHKCPKDGVEYGKSLRKLFPQNVRDEIENNHNEFIQHLEEIIKNRVKEDVEI